VDCIVRRSSLRHSPSSASAWPLTRGDFVEPREFDLELPQPEPNDHRGIRGRRCLGDDRVERGFVVFQLFGDELPATGDLRGEVTWPCLPGEHEPGEKRVGRPLRCPLRVRELVGEQASASVGRPVDFPLGSECVVAGVRCLDVCGRFELVE